MTAGTAANRTTTSASLAAIGRNGDERVTGPMAPVRASRPDLPGSLCAPPIAESRIVLDFGERGVHLLELPPDRSEEHTSELQSLMRISYAVFCLKKKKQHTQRPIPILVKTNIS